MVEKVIRRIAPAGLDFRDAWWYYTIEKKTAENRRRILLFTLFAGALFPLLIAAADAVSGQISTPLKYIVPFGVMAFISAVYALTGNIRIVIPVVLVGAFCSFIFAFWYPAADNTYFLLFLIFPLFAHQLKGSAEGSLWAVIFLLVSVLLAVTQRYSIVSMGQSYELRTYVIAGGIYAVIFSISFLIQRQQEGYIYDIVDKLLYDDTTRLPNRTMLMTSVPQEGRSLFAILHIENFGDLGVLFGYDLSDSILNHIAFCLNQIRGGYGFQIFKLKGQEFGVLLNEWSLDEDRSDSAIMSICAALQNEPIIWDGKELRVFVRAGGVIIDDASRKDFISKADTALRYGERFRRQVTIYSCDISGTGDVCSSSEMYSTLVTNRNNNDFKVYYQPVVDAVHNRIIFHECLLRVKGADGRYHSPEPYLAIAKMTGFDRYITEYVIEEACTAIRITGGSFSINMSYSDLMRSEVIDIICRRCSALDKNEGKLIIEILESEEIKNTQIIKGNLARLREAGCRIAIDDFGSGYANFTNMVDLDVDIVKIDGRLVKRCADDAATESLIRGIAHFCKQWGKEMVAEYVDCEAVSQMMTGIGVDYLQGYYFGIPAEMDFSAV